LRDNRIKQERDVEKQRLQLFNDALDREKEQLRLERLQQGQAKY
jgi:hypothetical protein